MALGVEARDFARSVAEILDDSWGNATSAAAGDLVGLAETVADLGWFELGSARALDFLIAAQRELGRRACPLPLVDAHVAAPVVDPGLRARVESADAKVLVVFSDNGDPGHFEHLEAAAGVTHVLQLPADGQAASLHQVQHAVATEGIAVPAWARVTVSADATRLDLAREHVEGAHATYRLGMAARALGAAERAHQLAVEHARTRRQFGKVIGAFGAVQQRVAARQVELSAARALLEDAVAQMLSGREHGNLAADLATQFVRDIATSVMFDAQHTLGAIGYFEEHEAPWLFRRVHADVAVLHALPGDVTRALVEGGRSLPAFDLGAVTEGFRGEVRALLAAYTLPDGGSYDVDGLRGAMAERGLFTIGWSEDDGGQDATVEEQVVLHEEMKYARGPVDRAMSASMLIGHAIRRHGTPDQKAEFLPLIQQGEMAFCLGYSEPEAGSDLASLRTRAVRDGDDWVINGQKTWTTRAHTASHVWLAVRTTADAHPRHAGITVFLLPVDTPGIEMQKHVALSGEVSCTVFYDAVRAPDSMRVGEVDGGWRVVTDALSAERVIMGGVAATLLRQMDDLLALLRLDPVGRLGPEGSHRRRRLASLAARLHAARALVLEATRSINAGRSALAAPMAAVLSGELAEDFGQAALEILGPGAALAHDAPGAVGEGVFEQALRLSPMYVIGGGTNDIQRALVARGLGLPRE